MAPRVVESESERVGLRAAGQVGEGADGLVARSQSVRLHRRAAKRVGSSADGCLGERACGPDSWAAW